MLTRIVVYNSKLYGKAEIRLDDCDSLQLVGPNNIGKSTLIYALNFLFIIDGNKMSFSGNRKGDKDTIHHYFPSPHQSFIVFEVFKNHPYCILVKRDLEGELEYYKFDTEYNENHYVDSTSGLPRFMKFDEIQEKLNAQGIVIYRFKNKTEVFNTVYQRGKIDNNAAVWLEDTVKADGLSNNFSKVYRYLINSKLINNKTLKEALIISDNREHEGLNFSQKNKKDITDLLRINDEVKSIKEVSSEFQEFREQVNVYNSKRKAVNELVSAFNKSYSTAVVEAENRAIKKNAEAVTLQNEVNEILKPQELELSKKIGGVESDVLNKTSVLAEKEKELAGINSFESVDFLTETLSNLDKERKDIETRLTQIESQKLSADQIRTKIRSLDDVIGRLEKQVANFNNQLIHKITEKKEDKKLLNFIFSPEFSSQSSELVKKKITRTSNLLNIFDGEVKLPSTLKLKELPNVDDLKEELEPLKTEKTEYEKLLKVAQDIEKANQRLAEIIEQIEQIKNKIRLIESKPVLVKVVDELLESVKALNTQKAKYEKELKVLMEDIAAKTSQLEALQDEKRKMESRLRELKERKLELESISVDAVDFESTESLDQIYTKVKLFHSQSEVLKANKDNAFNNLRYRVKSNLADENEFVRFMEDEIACINDKEKSIEGLLASISTQFANPAFTLIKRYEDFREFIINKFNQKLAQTRISDIESLRIELVDNKKTLGELKMISSIQNIQGQMTFDFDQSENLRLLNTYLDTGKKINFHELFDIELVLLRKGTEKKVDLAAQVESDGTDRMIRLVIIMAVINRLAISSSENRIALFIDEVATIDKNNRPELVKFCRDHHFIPIFAAPDAVPDFNKYYFIFPAKGKINLNDKNIAWQHEGGTQNDFKLSKQLL